MVTELSIAALYLEMMDRLRQVLGDAGCRITQAFDLQSAREALHDTTRIPCPNHGMAPWSFQYAVLLIYPPILPSVALQVMGDDDWTKVTLLGAAKEKPGKEAERRPGATLATLLSLETRYFAPQPEHICRMWSGRKRLH